MSRKFSFIPNTVNICLHCETCSLVSLDHLSTSHPLLPLTCLLHVSTHLLSHVCTLFQDQLITICCYNVTCVLEYLPVYVLLEAVICSSVGTENE